MLAKVRIVLFTVIMLLLSSPLRAGEVETVRFGVVMSLTGEFADLGRMHLAGVRMRLAEFNREASRYGFRLDMLLRDDRSNPDLAAEQTWELLSDPKVVGIVGSNASAVCNAMLPVVRDMGAVFISPSATCDDFGKNRDGSFRAVFGDIFQGEALARYVCGTLGLKRGACIINGRYDYSRGIGASFSRAFAAAGGRVVAEERYDGGADRDIPALLRRAAVGNPEVILTPVYAGDAGDILEEAGRQGLAAVFCGGDSWEQESVLAKAVLCPDGAYYVGVTDDSAETPAMRRFARTLRFTTEPHAQLGSSLGYDALTLLIEGLKKGTARAALRENMYTLGDVSLVSGPIRISADGIDKPAYIMKVVATPAGGVARQCVEVVAP